MNYPWRIYKDKEEIAIHYMDEDIKKKKGEIIKPLLKGEYTVKKIDYKNRKI